ncbi:MAG: PilN domain-containing protein [Candidatus Rokuibacteriota bacterium]
MIRINLAPEPERRGRTLGGFKLSLPSINNLATLFAVVYAVALLGAAGYWGLLWRTEVGLTRQIAAANQELTSLKARIGQLGKVKEQYVELQKRIEAIEGLTRDQTRPIHLLDAFADMIPRDLWITGLEESTSKLKLRGSAFSTTAVADLMSNLRASGRFKEVDIIVSRQDFAKAPRLVTFEVTCRFEI